MQQQYVIHAHYDELYRFVYYLVGDTYTANEIVQDTFVKFIQLNRSVEQPRAYLFKMARNLVNDYYRRQKLLQFVPFLSSHDRSTTEQLDGLVIETERNQQLYKALQQIKRHYREAIVCRYIYELSVSECAAILNCTEAQVKNHTSRGLKALRNILGEVERDEH